MDLLLGRKSPDGGWPAGTKALLCERSRVWRSRLARWMHRWSELQASDCARTSNLGRGAAVARGTTQGLCPQDFLVDGISRRRFERASDRSPRREPDSQG